MSISVHVHCDVLGPDDQPCPSTEEVDGDYSPLPQGWISIQHFRPASREDDAVAHAMDAMQPVLAAAPKLADEDGAKVMAAMEDVLEQRIAEMPSVQRWSHVCPLHSHGWKLRSEE